MTHKEQNKILDDKIESNVNQYKVDRLNAESGNLNKYEFLTKKDLKHKLNALDKARFEFSLLGKAFSTELDKTVPNYQEEGVTKSLKDIRDGLRGGIGPPGPQGPGVRPQPGGPDRQDDDDDDDDEQKRLSKLLGELRTYKDNEEFRNKPKEDKLDKFVNDNTG